jgi:hypothetical protein
MDGMGFFIFWDGWDGIKIIRFIVSKEIKAEIGDLIFLSFFLAKRVKSQRGRN